MDMAVAGTADVKNCAQALLPVEALADTLESMGASRNQMMAGRTQAAAPAKRAGIARRWAHSVRVRISRTSTYTICASQSPAATGIVASVSQPNTPAL